MKTNIIKALFGLILTFSISGLYAQSPRIKLNQIVKDTISGSVLISNLADSNMVYSRNFYINAADTSLVFFGTTIVAGSGGGGSFVTLPQLTDSLALYATKVQLSDSMATVLKQVATDLTLTGDGSVGNPLKVDTATVIATKGDLSDYVTIAGTQTITGAKTFTNTLTQSGGDVNFDNGTLFVDESADRVGIGTTSPTSTLDLRGNINQSGTGNVNNEFESTTPTGRFIQSIKNDVGAAFQQGVFGSNNSQTLFGRTETRIAFIYTTAFISTFPTVFVLGSFGNQDLVLGTNNTERLTIAANGDVSLDAYGAITDLRLDANGKFFDGASDERLKNSINDLKFGLNEVMLLKPKEFWRNDVNQNYDLKEVGFIAQDVRSVIPNAVVNSKSGYFQLRTDAILATSVKAIQEQQAIIESQATEIEQLKSQIQLILNEIEQLKNN